MNKNSPISVLNQTPHWRDASSLFLFMYGNSFLREKWIMLFFHVYIVKIIKIAEHDSILGRFSLYIDQETHLSIGLRYLSDMLLHCMCDYTWLAAIPFPFQLSNCNFFAVTIFKCYLTHRIFGSYTIDYNAIFAVHSRVLLSYFNHLNAVKNINTISMHFYNSITWLWPFIKQ